MDGRSARWEEESEPLKQSLEDHSCVQLEKPLHSEWDLMGGELLGDSSQQRSGLLLVFPVVECHVFADLY